ncbi:MAG: long-chain fatty acid--CoA ligase [Nitriliruptoraceae bacterium]
MTSASVLEQRDEIVAETAGKTLADVFMATCDANGGNPALVVKHDDDFVTHTWSDYRTAARGVAMGLRDLGVERGDFVAMMMSNRPEHVIADVGVVLAGATPVSVYNTLTALQMAFIANDCRAPVIIVEDDQFAQRWLDIADQLDHLRHIVVVDSTGLVDDARVLTWQELAARGNTAVEHDPAAFEAAWRAVEPDDAATLIYTSGTTGPPKGVILSHRNVLYQLGVIQRLLDVRPGQRGISYLPLAHVAERMVTHYIGVRYGGTIYFVRDLTQVVDTLQAARPQMFMAVPRVWEKMYAAILAKIDDDPKKAPIAHRAIDVATRAVQAELDGRAPSLALRAQRALFDKLVFSKIRHGLGLDQLRYAISGAAPISPQLLTFYQAIGIEILEVYGMTETTAVITANRPGQARIGTVGTPLPGVEVQLSDDGEILTRGPNVTPGYWQKPEATAELIDADGWLHTGDLGVMDDDGYVTISGRKKELIITAGGKNLSPNNIEEAIKQQSPIIGQICAVGDNRSYIAALVVLDGELLPGWCQRTDLAFTSVAGLAEHPAIIEEVARAVEAGNDLLARVEQVKRWAILTDEWTAESDELTPSMKLKRDVVHKNYAQVIESLYDN